MLFAGSYKRHEKPHYDIFPCPDEDIVACLVNPCEVTSCAKIPNAVCKYVVIKLEF